MPGPLDGVRILDVSAIISGPFGSQLLADQGAEVIKIEPPGIGDLTRVSGMVRGGLAPLFLNVNRGKRSIVLDLTKPKGQEIARELAKGVDVFLQNFRPGAVERLGLGEADLRKVNPDIIYASVSGYGESGPYSDRRVYDPIIQGLTGYVAIQQSQDIPIRDLVRNIVCDKASAYTMAQAITAALFARERGAGGQHVRVPMIDAGLAFFWPDGMQKHTFTGPDVGPGNALYEVYRLTETADGHLIYFTASEKEFLGLFRALGREDLCTHPQFGEGAPRAKHMEELGTILLQEFAKWPTEEIAARMVAEEVPVGPVLSLDEVFDDPQIRHNDAILERTHPTAGSVREARPAARFDKTPSEVGAIAPLHGEHTDDVLAEIGITGDALAALKEEGIVGA